jgi:hypothetical protein
MSFLINEINLISYLFLLNHYIKIMSENHLNLKNIYCLSVFIFLNCLYVTLNISPIYSGSGRYISTGNFFIFIFTLNNRCKTI